MYEETARKELEEIMGGRVIRIPELGCDPGSESESDGKKSHLNIWIISNSYRY